MKNRCINQPLQDFTPKDLGPKSRLNLITSKRFIPFNSHPHDPSGLPTKVLCLLSSTREL